MIILRHEEAIINPFILCPPPPFHLRHRAGHDEGDRPLLSQRGGSNVNLPEMSTWKNSYNKHLHLEHVGSPGRGNTPVYCAVQQSRDSREQHLIASSAAKNFQLQCTSAPPGVSFRSYNRAECTLHSTAQCRVLTCAL